MVSALEVEMAYRLILGREPESLSAVEYHCAKCASLPALRETLLESVEFRSHKRNVIQPDVDYNPPMTVETKLAPSVLGQMFERVEQFWRTLGNTEPYWSVATHERYKSDSFNANASEFYASGRRDFERLMAWLRRNHIDAAAIRTCCEYGCGVGRTTPYLCSQFSHVFACDVSEPHLELARQHLLAEGHSNVTIQKIDSLLRPSQISHVDLVFSIIVLQHNPPPVIAHLIKMLLRSLTAGGLAFFQVPTYALGYRFGAKEYLRLPAEGSTMEMHVLPQSSIFEIVREEGCTVLEVQPDTYLDSTQWISNTFLVERSK